MYLSILLPQEVHDKLHSLSVRRSKTAAMTALIRGYDGTPLEAPKSSQSGFVMEEDVIAALDAITAKNGLKSRSQTLSLLIEKACAKTQGETK